MIERLDVYEMYVEPVLCPKKKDFHTFIYLIIWVKASWEDRRQVFRNFLTGGGSLNSENLRANRNLLIATARSILLRS
jgi:hypothetical protein